MAVDRLSVCCNFLVLLSFGDSVKLRFLLRRMALELRKLLESITKRGSFTTFQEFDFSMIILRSFRNMTW